MTVKELTNCFKVLIKQGDIKEDSEVILSCDSEGNRFFTVDPKNSFGVENNKLVIYPSRRVIL